MRLVKLSSQMLQNGRRLPLHLHVLNNSITLIAVNIFTHKANVEPIVNNFSKYTYQEEEREECDDRQVGNAKKYSSNNNFRLIVRSNNNNYFSFYATHHALSANGSSLFEGVRCTSSCSYAGIRAPQRLILPSAWLPLAFAQSREATTKSTSSTVKPIVPPLPSLSFKLPPPPPLTGAFGNTSTVTEMPWRTAQEVLSYFVEYIPTFYVPLNSIAAMLPDHIRSLFLGRNKFFTFIRRYPFFFDLRQKDAGARWDVKLNDDVNHPKKGTGDEKFMIIDVGERVNYVAKPEFVVSTENIDTALMSVAITPQEVPPAMRVQLEERVPVLERLKSLMPVEFTPVDVVEHDLPEDILYHPYFDCQGGLSAIANKFPEHFQLVDNRVRLRRPHLAPLALDEFTLDNSPLPEVAALLQKEVCDSEIPHWVRLTPLYELLSRQQRQEIKRTFRSFAGFVRTHGRSLSISTDMLQVAMWITSAQAPEELTTEANGNTSSNDKRETMPLEKLSTDTIDVKEMTKEIKSNNNNNNSNCNSHDESVGCKTDKTAASSFVNNNETNNACNTMENIQTQPQRSLHPTLTVYDSAVHKTYSAMEIINELFDRFPFARSLSLVEAIALLPEKMQRVCSPTQVNKWLKDYTEYFEVENPTEHDANAVCIRRTSDRQPLDIAMILYKHLPSDKTELSESELLKLLSPSHRKIISHIGVPFLPKILPQWIAVSDVKNAKNNVCERTIRVLRSLDELERAVSKTEVFKK